MTKYRIICTHTNKPITHQDGQQREFHSATFAALFMIDHQLSSPEYYYEPITPER